MVAALSGKSAHPEFGNDSVSTRDCVRDADDRPETIAPGFALAAGPRASVRFRSYDDGRWRRRRARLRMMPAVVTGGFGWLTAGAADRS